MIKIIAIGNSLMGDDGIALKVIDSIETKINQLDLGIKCISAETDFNYALDNIEDGDFLFILDSTLIGVEYGQITQISLKEINKYQGTGLSIHNISLLSLIKHFKMDIGGNILGIEVAEVKFSLESSNELKERFDQICNEVYTIIKKDSLAYIKNGESSA